MMSNLLRRSAHVTRPHLLRGWAALVTDTSKLNPSTIIAMASSPTGVPLTAPARVCSRKFHASAGVLLPVRRKRRGGIKQFEDPPPSENKGSSDDDRDGTDMDGRSRGTALQHPPVQDVLKFRQAAAALFDKLERALEPMKAKNDYFVVERLDGEIGEVLRLDLGPKEGFYELEISEDECIFQYSSPISGQILYCLSSDSGEWVGCNDGHLFEGIFVRDLIRQCQGLPNL